MLVILVSPKILSVAFASSIRRVELFDLLSLISDLLIVVFFPYTATTLPTAFAFLIFMSSNVTLSARTLIAAPSLSP